MECHLFDQENGLKEDQKLIGYSPSRHRKHLQRHTHRQHRSKAATQDTEMIVVRAGPTATHTHTHDVYQQIYDNP